MPRRLQNRPPGWPDAISYRVERLARERGLSGEDPRLLRQQGARPVLSKLLAFLSEVREQLLPKSEAGHAVNYILKTGPR